MILQITTGIIIGTGMSFFMSGIITGVNTGIEDGFILRWMKAWGIAWLIATPKADVIGPLARKLALRIVGNTKV